MVSLSEPFGSQFTEFTGYDFLTGPKGWEEVFTRAQKDLIHVMKILERESGEGRPWVPFHYEIFKALELTPLKEVRVVILGQDPYYQMINIKNQEGKAISVPRAVGMSFSARRQDGIPDSLANIYKELQNTTGFKSPYHGDLTQWAEQGVLLLNSCLTTTIGKAGQHGQIWSGLVTKIIDAIAETRPECIYLLWGRDAQKIKKRIGKKSIVFEGAHPSPLSAYRGFFGGDYFNKTNEVLTKMGDKPIDWQII